MKKRFSLVLFVFLLLLIPFSLSLSGTEFSPSELCAFFSLLPEECAFFAPETLCSYLMETQFVDTFYDPETDICYLLEETAPPESASPPSSSSTPPSLEPSASSLEADLSELKETLSSVEQKLSSLETSQGTLTGQLSEIKNSLQNLDSQINQQLNTVSTGLAGLQTDLISTQSNLEAVEEDLAGKTSFTTFLLYLFFLALILAVAFGVFYYITRRKKASPSLSAHIRRHLQRGRSFSEIKSGLIKQGWSEGLIDWAHQKTIKSAPSEKIPSPQLTTFSSKKIIPILFISLLLLFGLILLLSETNLGKAIQYTLQDKGHQIDIVCYPPQILSPGGFGCCTDSNQNSLCDLEEDYGSLRPAPEDEPLVCLGSRDCASGRECINKRCGYLHDLSSSGCPSVCQIISATLSTSDGETYSSVVIGRGGYTAAGSLAWTLLPSPEFCRPDQALLPLEITLKKSTSFTDQEGKAKTRIKIVSREVLTLKKGQTSRTLKHFSVPHLAFTLTLDELNIKCY